MRSFWTRIAAFVALFSCLPCLAALLSALRSSSRIEVIGEAMKADASFAFTAILQPALVSLLVAVILGAASLWAWPPTARHAWWRTLRFFLGFCAVMYVCHPAFAAMVPFLRSVPIGVALGLMLIGVVASHAFPGARATWREAVYSIAACVAFFASPDIEVDAEKFRASVGREFNRSDVLLLGFDSMSFREAQATLADFKPAAGSKTVFENASTPVAATNAAWRAVLSGCYPHPHALPGDRWGHEKQSWLPTQLRERGYQVAMIQDDPTTNVYGRDEAIEIPTEQGWKWMMLTFAWRTVFPLYEVGGSWWLERLGGPVPYSNRFGYNPVYFQEILLRQIAERARRGPVFIAAHTCFAHTPIHLTMGEVLTLKDWYKKTPRDLQGGTDPVNNMENLNYREVAAARAESARALMARTLRRWEEVGIIGKASTFILSDHGPRASWISTAGAHHVVLAAFLPEQRPEVSVPEAVSLVDIAPTVRELIGLAPRHSDGETLLPLGSEQSRNRQTKQMSSRSVASGSAKLFNLRGLELPGNVLYHADGTFGLSPKLREDIRVLMEREDRALRALEILGGNGQRPAEEPPE